MPGQHNDSRMNMALVMTAVQHGATVANHVEVTGLQKKLDESRGTDRIIGVEVKDRMTGESFPIRTRVSNLVSGR